MADTTAPTCADCTRPIIGTDGRELNGQLLHAACFERAGYAEPSNRDPETYGLGLPDGGVMEGTNRTTSGGIGQP